MKCNAKSQAICIPRNDCGCLNPAISGMNPCQTPLLIPSNQRMSTTVQYPLAYWLIGPSPATTRPKNPSMPWYTARSPKMVRDALPQAAESALRPLLNEQLEIQFPKSKLLFPNFRRPDYSHAASTKSFNFAARIRCGRPSIKPALKNTMVSSCSRSTI